MEGANEDDVFEEMGAHVDHGLYTANFTHDLHVETSPQSLGQPMDENFSFTSVEYNHHSRGFPVSGPVVHEGFVPKGDDGFAFESEIDEVSCHLSAGLTVREQSRRRSGSVFSDLGSRVSGASVESEEQGLDDEALDVEDCDEALPELDESVQVMDPDFIPSDNGHDPTQDEASDPDGSSSEVDVALQGEGRRGPSRGHGRGRGRGRGRPRRRGWRALLRELSPPKRGRGAPRRQSLRGTRRAKRRPRAVAEPSREFKQLQAKATEAFLSNHDPTEALDYARQAVQTNPEIFAAHSLLSEILLSMGRKEDSVGALLSGAHTKRDPKLWWHVADRTMELGGEDVEAVLGQAYYCYTQIVRLDPQDFDARAQRLKIHLELNYRGRAKKECEAMLKIRPHDTEILRQLAELSTTSAEAGQAKDLYEKAIEHFMNGDEEQQARFTWSSLNIFLELLDHIGAYTEGTQKLRRLARWLLGRKEETFWDEQEDDREWDLQDIPRRCQVESFVPGRHGLETYGEGLPLELRTKLGLFRLKMGESYLEEALHHFEFLDPTDLSPNGKVHDYDDLYREVADGLKSMGYVEEALRFYEPLRKISSTQGSSYYLSLADCYRELGSLKEAEDLYRSLLDQGTENTEARVRLAKLYEQLGMADKAQELVVEIMKLGRRDLLKRANLRIEQPETAQRSERAGDTAGPAVVRRPPAPIGKQRKLSSAQKLRQNVSWLKKLAIQTSIQQVKLNLDKLDAGDADATRAWTDAAGFLVEIVGKEKVFAPLRDRSSRPEALIELRNDDEVNVARYRALIEKCQPANGLQCETSTYDDESGSHGTSFDDWLQILCRFSLALAEQRQSERCWQVLTTIAESGTLMRTEDRMQLLHACWLACALRLGNDQHICNESRWFLKKYPAAGESFELFNSTGRMCARPQAWFSSSPYQKFILRQIRGLDNALLNHDAACTKGESGHLSLTELNPAAFATYGHVLAMSGSYPIALYYYFRAYALQPNDPILNLCIASAYVQQALKRQAENRQVQIQQGLAFLLRYHAIRTTDGVALHSQEAEYNLGRMWHLLGLNNLALESYGNCLKITDQVQMEEREGRSAVAGRPTRDFTTGSGDVEETRTFAAEAAFAMQTIYVLGGDLDAAKRITEKWLVI